LMACQKERCSRPFMISEIFSQRSLLGVERGKRRLVVHADTARLHTTKVRRAFCNDNFLRIAPHSQCPSYSPGLAPSDFLTFSYLSISKIASKDNKSGLQMICFRKSAKIWTKSALAHWKRFSMSWSTDWTDILDCSK
jgi:hypothetical protein